MQTPTLVIGHQYDIIHPFSDAGMLAEELPNGRLLQANSLIELRVAPRRLTDEIARFIDACWRPRAARAARARVLIAVWSLPSPAGMSSRQEEKERRRREREEREAAEKASAARRKRLQ